MQTPKPKPDITMRVGRVMPAEHRTCARRFGLPITNSSQTPVH